MSENIELKAEVHSETVSKNVQVQETAVEEATTQSSESVGEADRERKGKGGKGSESDISQKNDDSSERKDSGSETESSKKDGGQVEGDDKGEGEEGKGMEREGAGSLPLIGTEETVELKGKQQDKDDQQNYNDDVVQQEPTSMAEENSQQNASAAESERVAPVCQLARAQASIQAKMRPGIWLPGARNLHMSREIWEIKATPDECLDRLVAAVDDIPQQELLEVSKLDKNRHFAEIFAFTANCNWLDVVEVTFHNGEETGTTRGEIVSFSSGLFPVWMPLSFICNCCCFCVPFAGHGQNTRRIELIKNALQLEVTVKH